MKIKKLLFYLVFVLCFLGFEKESRAASADIVFSAEETNVNVGDIFSVEMNVSSDVYPGDFEGYIQYASDKLEYISGPEVIVGGEGVLRINDSVLSSDRYTRKYVMKFRALDTGTADITMRQEPSVYEFESGYLLSVSYNTLRLMIFPSKQASSDATLKSLKISPGKLEPAFSNDEKEYTASVSNDVTSLIVSAVSNSDDAVVSIEGNNDLQVGQNRIVVRVKAEDGNESKFVIYCVREKEAEPDNGEPVDTELPDVEDVFGSDEHFSFYANEENGNVYITSDSRYSVVEDVSGIEIPKGFTKTSIIVSNIKIPVYSPADDLSAEFLLMVLSKNGENPGLYRYDRTEKTIQRFVSTDVVYKNENKTHSEEPSSELEAKYNKSVSTLTTIIAVLCGICVVLLIVIIRFAILSRANKDDLPD